MVITEYQVLKLFFINEKPLVNLSSPYVPSPFQYNKSLMSHSSPSNIHTINFFPTDNSLLIHRIGNPLDGIPNQSTDFIQHDESLGSNTSLTQRDIMGLDKLMNIPMKSKRFKVKQFSIDDFAFEMNNPISSFNLQY